MASPALGSSVQQPSGPQLVIDAEKEPKPEGWTRFVCFSDTHGLHYAIPPAHTPVADVLLHAGDFSDTGELEVVRSFAEWLRAYPASHKVVIAGNHDVTLDEAFYRCNWRLFHPERQRPYKCREVRCALGGCTYLQDTAVEVCGYRIYGSPQQPAFSDWAFNLPRGLPLRKVWERIPPGTDILMTHSPPYGILDRCLSGYHAGCRDLLDAIEQRDVPVSLFGHIHEGYCVKRHGATLFINASTCTVGHRPSNPLVVFDLLPPHELRQGASAIGVAEAAAVGSVCSMDELHTPSLCPVCDGTGLLLDDCCPLCDGIVQDCPITLSASRQVSSV